LILGGRYGSVESASGKSYIQLEYEHAVASGKRFFAVLLNDEFIQSKNVALVKRKKSAVEGKNPEKNADFARLVKTKLCKIVGTKDAIKIAVMQSLSKLTGEMTTGGWVRASTVVDAKPLADQIARLQGENDALRAARDALRVQSQDHTILGKP